MAAARGAVPGRVRILLSILHVAFFVGDARSTSPVDAYAIADMDRYASVSQGLAARINGLAMPPIAEPVAALVVFCAIPIRHLRRPWTPGTGVEDQFFFVGERKAVVLLEGLGERSVVGVRTGRKPHADMFSSVRRRIRSAIHRCIGSPIRQTRACLGRRSVDADAADRRFVRRTCAEQDERVRSTSSAHRAPHGFLHRGSFPPGPPSLKDCHGIPGSTIGDRV